VRALAYVLLIAVSAAMVMASDLFLRSQSIPGTDPHSWDVAGSWGMGIGLGLLLVDAWRRDE